jgi:isopenicillin N synthase-like dioxygenase
MSSFLSLSLASSSLLFLVLTRLRTSRRLHRFHLIPTIDLSLYFHGDDEQKQKVVRQWDKAFRTTGFCTIVGSGVPTDVTGAMYEQALAFFQQSHEEKMKSCKHKGYGQGGFVPVGVESVARSTGSAKDKETPFDVSADYFIVLL